MLHVLATVPPECQKGSGTRRLAMALAKDNVSYRLLDKLSNLVICSRCLRGGKVTPVPQIISGRHALTNECGDCRAQNPERYGYGARHAKLLKLHN